MTVRQSPILRSPRSLEVTRTFLGRGSSVSRSVWVHVAPRNPVLRAVMAVPAVSLAALAFFLILVMLGFMMLAVVLMSLMPRRRGKSPR